MSFLNNEEDASSLLSGIQWDCLCQWLIYTNSKTYEEVKEDSMSWGIYYNSTFQYVNKDGIIKIKSKNSSKKVPAGSTEYTMVNNIYDIAGNVEEWTAEREPEYRIERGGSYLNSGDVFSATGRYSNVATYTNDNVGDIG